jgi:hypothetical protein
MINWVKDLAETGKLTDKSFLSDRSMWCTVGMMGLLLKGHVTRTAWRLLIEADTEGYCRFGEGKEAAADIFFSDIAEGANEQHYIYYNGAHFWPVGPHSGERWEDGANDAQRIEEALLNLCESIVAGWSCAGPAGTGTAEQKGKGPKAAGTTQHSIEECVGYGTKTNKAEQVSGKLLLNRGLVKCAECTYPICTRDEHKVHQCNGPLARAQWREADRMAQLVVVNDWLEAQPRGEKEASTKHGEGTTAEPEDEQADAGTSVPGS